VRKFSFQFPATPAGAVRLAAALALTVVCVRSAWVCDDAFITLRTVDNFVHGYGLRWNVAERVQTFTHPLWALLLVPFYAATREAYYTVLGLSLALSGGLACWLTLRVAGSTAAALLVAAILVSSKAFVDFSTSGLENPLTHVLLVAFVVLCLPPPGSAVRPAAVTFVAGLLALTRLDTLLLTLPAMGLVLRDAGRRRALLALWGFLPLLVWELFATFYYGAPFPNTAYAKLGTGIARAELLRQGLAYVSNSLRVDPVTLPVVALAAAFAAWRRDRTAIALSAGSLLYIGYVVWIGGDFMSGRFFAAPLVLAVTLLARRLPARSPRWARASALAVPVVLVVGLLPATAPLRSGADYAERHRAHAADAARITDERAFYYAETGLLRARRGVPMPHHPSAHEGKEARAAGPGLVVRGGVGFFGYYAGPAWHIVEKWAVCDPLLARLPVPEGTFWRIGHFTRPVPAGYLESLRTGRNLVADPGIAALWDTVRLVTRGPLLSRERLAGIVRLNLGGEVRPAPETSARRR
jgi:arabinofuranosyltransferase